MDRQPYAPLFLLQSRNFSRLRTAGEFEPHEVDTRRHLDTLVILSFPYHKLSHGMTLVTTSVPTWRPDVVDPQANGAAAPVKNHGLISITIYITGFYNIFLESCRDFCYSFLSSTRARNSPLLID
jgi:hypothetical protein